MRSAIWTVVLTLLVALVVVGSELRYGVVSDERPDDRVLVTMQQIASAAQTVLDETGEVPNSLDDVLRAVYPNYPQRRISYQRIRATTIRLCGEFIKPSSGQVTARPFSDVSVSLLPGLTAPRPAAGRHCYDVMLESTEPSLREDALLFREMNAAATAVECVFSASAVLPSMIPTEDTLRGREFSDPACWPRKFIVRVHQQVEYAPIGAAAIRLCAKFRRGYFTSGKPARVFDPRSDARFDELAQTRPEPGRRCYALKMLLPDPQREVPPAAWDEPIDVEALPIAMRAAAAQDKRAIGDVVNVLRLARCALTMSTGAPSSVEEAIRVVALRPRIAERYECDWVPRYFASNFPVASYEQIESGRVRVCAGFRHAWDRPLALNYHREALTDWPTSLPELQRAISGPGRHCFTVRLTAIGSGVT